MVTNNFIVHNNVTLPAAAITAITGTTAATGGIIRISYHDLALRFPEFHLVGRTITDASTSPGSSKTITFSLMWSQYDLSASYSTIATVLADRKTDLSAVTLTDATSTTQEWMFTSSAIRPLGNYLYIGFIKDATDATVTLDTMIQRVPSPTSRIDV